MANGRINLGKQSGGTLGLLFPDGTTNTEVTLPESGTLATTAGATETVAGIIELATTAETQSGTDDVRAITPLKLFNSLKGSNQSLSAKGYQKLHGGLIIQWGATANIAAGGTATITFPIAFTTLIFGVNATFKATGSSNDNGIAAPQVNTQSLTGCTIRSYDGDTGAPAFWFAIGY